MTLTKPVVKITNSGAFVNLEEGIDGFLHIDDISWTKKIRNMSEFCKEGDVIDSLCLFNQGRSPDKKAHTVSDVKQPRGHILGRSLHGTRLHKRKA